MNSSSDSNKQPTIAISFNQVVGGAGAESIKKAFDESVKGCKTQYIDYRKIISEYENTESIYSDENKLLQVFRMAKQKAEAFLQNADCLIIPGNCAMVDPRLYGSPRGEDRIDLERAIAELALIHVASSRGMPIMGICGGHQLINVYFGGKLKALDDEALSKAQRPGSFCTVVIEGQSELAQIMKKNINSIETASESEVEYVDSKTRDENTIPPLIQNLYGAHKQAVEEIGGSNLINEKLDYLRVVGNATDKAQSIEAVEASYGSPLFGLQFHPEFGYQLAKTEDVRISNLNIFKELKKAARTFRNKRELNLSIRNMNAIVMQNVKDDVKINVIDNANDLLKNIKEHLKTGTDTPFIQNDSTKLKTSNYKEKLNRISTSNSAEIFLKNPEHFLIALSNLDEQEKIKILYSDILAELLDSKINKRIMKKVFNQLDINNLVRLNFNQIIKKENAGILQIIASDHRLQAGIISRDGRSLLRYAIENGDHTSVVELIKKGADVNQKFQDARDAFNIAIEGGNIAICNTLLDHGFNLKNTDLISSYAIFSAERLIGEGIEGAEELLNRIIKGVANLNESNWMHGTPLEYAVKNKIEPAVKALLDNNADPNSENVIIDACRSHNINIIRMLIDHGADINRLFAINDYDVVTPLITALEAGYENVINELINRGAELNNTFALPLIHCCNYGSFGVSLAERFIDHGANVDLESDKKKTPLLAAIGGFNNEMVALLIRKGADVNKPNSDGLTPIMYAIDERSDTLVYSLIEAGANHFFNELISVESVKHAMDSLKDNDILDNGKMVLANNLIGGIERLIENKEIQASVGISILDMAIDHDVFKGSKEIIERKYNELDMKASGRGVDAGISTRDGRRLLRSAVENGDHASVVELAKKGVNINQKFQDGSDAFDLAIKRGNIAMCNTLLDHGVNVNRELSKKTPLLSAIGYGNSQMVELLIRKGVDVNKANSYGFTPLNSAIDQDNRAVVYSLLEAGANHFFNKSFFFDNEISVESVESAIKLLKNNNILENDKMVLAKNLICGIEKLIISKEIQLSLATAILDMARVNDVFQPSKEILDKKYNQLVAATVDHQSVTEPATRARSDSIESVHSTASGDPADSHGNSLRSSSAGSNISAEDPVPASTLPPSQNNESSLTVSTIKHIENFVCSESAKAYWENKPKSESVVKMREILAQDIGIEDKKQLLTELLSNLPQPHASSTSQVSSRMFSRAPSGAAEFYSDVAKLLSDETSNASKARIIYKWTAQIPEKEEQKQTLEPPEAAP